MAGLALAFRTVFVYVLVIVVMRVMGKREIGRLSVVDLVVFIMIAEIGVLVVEDTSKPLVNALLPILTLMAVQILSAFLAMKSQRIRDLFEGRPSYLIKHGAINSAEMRRHRYNLDELMGQLREQRILNVSDVEFAILETSGKLTVVEKDPGMSDPQKDSLMYRYGGLPLPLIMDGKVQDANLEKIGQTRFWLKDEMRKRAIKDFKEVFFCSIDHRGRLFIDKKR